MLNPGHSLATSSQLYTDVNGLGSLRSSDPQARIDEVARQFEGIMLQMMLKSMRDANAVFSEGNPLSSSETQFYQEMFDHQLSLTMAQQGGLGLAAVLRRQLGGTAAPAVPALRQPDDSLDPALRQMSRQSLPGGNPIPGAALQGAGLAGNPLIERMLARLPVLPERAQPEAPVTAPRGFDGTPAEFVAAVAPLAEQAGAALGVDGRVLVSQAALETGWGGKMLQRADGTPSYNFFNIKAGRSWQGAVVNVPTLEYRDGVAVREMAAFRAYETPAEGFADYVRLIRDNPRYREALQQVGDPGNYMQALAEAGYATDPSYADKVMKVLATDHIQSADTF